MKQFKSLALAFVVALAGISSFAADTWVVDKAHSESTFQIRHLVTKVGGKFGEFTGVVTADPANLAASSVEFTIKTASIDTGNADRDKHLRSPDFFDVEKFPEITFKSTSIKSAGKKDEYEVTGNLTMHGVTKKVTLPVTFLGTANMGGKPRAGFETHAKLNRKDYGINWNKALDSGSFLLSDDVDVTINIEASKK